MLAIWAADCAEHVLPLFARERPEDDRPAMAIATARAWANGEATVGQARAASVAAHAAAREATEGAARYAARVAGHAVAVAHMADHALGVSYAIKAVRAAGGTKSPAADQERAWQFDRVPEDIRDLVFTEEEIKSGFKLGTA